MALWRISLTIAAEAAEAVTELLESVFITAPASYTDVKTGRTTVTVYVAKHLASSLARRAQIRAGLKRIQACGLELGRPGFKTAPVPRENWAESWKRHFKPLEISNKLLIKPSWSKRRAKKGQAVVVLDPGLSFGTGQHPTTSFCLEELASVATRREGAGFLDIGTGSGILAVAAAKLGFSPVDAFDFDAKAVRIARANARTNGVAGRIHLFDQDVRKLKSRRKYSFICANLISTLIASAQEQILARLRPDGTLVLAGILKTEFPVLQRRYERAGLTLVRSRQEKEWRSGSFRWS